MYTYRGQASCFFTKLIVGGSSPFNIADQVSLTPFSLKNVKDLYTQYTQETNQPFTWGAVNKVYEETAGQPWFWLVNRLKKYRVR